MTRKKKLELEIHARIVNYIVMWVVYFCLCVLLDMCLGSTEGREELQSRSKLLHLLDAVTDALVWAIAKTGLTFREQYTRLAHLLMLLSHIRHLR